MTMRFVLLGMAAGMMAAASPAAAAAEKGYRVRYLADRGHYCISPVKASDAERLGIPLHTTECHTASVWAAMGITVSRA